MKKILVIEDDQDIADIVEMALADKYMVQTETDNNHILDSFKDFRPDLIMVDNQIGQRYASDIMSELKNSIDYNNVPFVLFSGHEDIRRIANEIEANAFLPKPFALVDLYKCIDVVLSKCA